MHRAVVPNVSETSSHAVVPAYAARSHRRTSHARRIHQSAGSFRGAKGGCLCARLGQRSQIFGRRFHRLIHSTNAECHPAERETKLPGVQWRLRHGSAAGILFAPARTMVPANRPNPETIKNPRWRRQLQDFGTATAPLSRLFVAAHEFAHPVAAQLPPTLRRPSHHRQQLLPIEWMFAGESSSVSPPAIDYD
jgi:hypothetical protein